MKKVLLITIAMMAIIVSVSAQNGTGYTKKQADNLVLNTLLISDLESSDVYSLDTLISKNDTIWHFDGSFIKSPYNTAWAYFVDDCPFANWVHPCRYIFVNATNGNYLLINSELPPEHFHFTPLSLFTRPTPVPYDNGAIETPMVKTVQDNPHLFAVLICGSEGASEYRFKNDVSAVYSTLTNVYGYPKSNIYVLYNTGSSLFGNDLDGDGDPDINYNARKETITDVFNELSGKSNDYPEIPELDVDDQLFIFVDDHGNSTNGISRFTTPSTPYYDTTMARDLEQVKCAQMIVLMQPCNSGGFPVRLTDYVNYNVQCKNRSVHSAADYESSWSEYILTKNMYCEFTYYWVAAARGYYPACNPSSWQNTHPWNNSYMVGTNPFIPHNPDYFYSNGYNHQNHPDFNPDMNNDGFVQMEEVFYYASYFDRYSPIGFYTILFGGGTENPQQNINIGFHDDDPLLTLNGLAGNVSVSQSVDNRNYLCGGNLTIDQGKTVTFNTGSKFFVAQNNNIKVQNNAVLTIKGLMRFGANAKVTVSQGGLLNIDGSHLAGWDNKQWQGIRVLGNNNAPQLPASQGCLNISNNALIEDAEVAVNLRNLLTNTSGGIVMASNSTFHNNTISLNIPAYNYSFSSSYESEFSNCLFTIDDSFLDNAFSTHVRLENINGIHFAGCQFQMNNSGYHTDVSSSSGIFAYNASPSFTEYCLSSTQPCFDVQKCTFDNFKKAAIFSISDLGSLNTLLVSNAVFTNNSKGIFSKNSNQVTIVLSDFYIGSDDNCSYGVLLDNTPSFNIQDNTFNPVYNTESQTYGLYVKNSNAVNRVHYNMFSNLYCANLAEGQNWMGKRFLGLYYTCNSHSNNTFDFYVLDDPTRYSGIQINQGSNNAPARNTLSSNASYQIYNGGEYAIDYYYNCGYPGETPDPNKIFHINPYNTRALYDCVSNYSEGTLSLTEAEVIQREQAYYDAYSNYMAVKQLYESRIDGGNTSATVADIENATSSDVWRLRSQLLGSSPYLSQTVLMTIAEHNDVFPASVLMEILSANPEELKEDTLINYLQANELLPDYAISILQQVATGTSYRTVMQQQMAEYRHEYTEAVYDIIRSILNDSIVNYAALRGWLGNLEDINADHAIIATYMEEGDSISAFTLVGLLPQLYELDGDELTDHFNYVQLLSLYQNLKQSERSVFEMTETEMMLVEDIANNSYGVSKSMAEAILDVLGEYSYTDCPILSTTIGSRGTYPSQEGQINGKDMELKVNLSPNPAANWISVEYKLPDGWSEASFVITNMLGIKNASVCLEGNQGCKVIDLTNMASGIYSCILRCGSFVKTEKLVITK